MFYVIQSKMNWHLGIYGLINESQHEFVKGKLCLTNLIEFFDEVTERVHEGSAVDDV